MTLTALQCTLQFCTETSTENLVWHYRMLVLRETELRKHLCKICSDEIFLKYSKLKLTMQLIYDELETRYTTIIPDGIMLDIINGGLGFKFFGI